MNSWQVANRWFGSFAVPRRSTSSIAGGSTTSELSGGISWARWPWITSCTPPWNGGLPLRHA